MQKSVALFAQHPRQWLRNWYVYPVISRRSKGLSIGVNLNPDKRCNFDCIYCSVDRTIIDDTVRVDMGRLRDELDEMLSLAASGEIFTLPPLHDTPQALRRLNDVAFSG